MTVSIGRAQARWVGVAALLVMITGCEHGFRLRGQATVPGEVQRMFSPEAPGLLVMGGGQGGATVSPELLAVLCAPASAEMPVPLAYDRLGCATEGTLWFKVIPLGSVAARPACGIRQENYWAMFNRNQVPRLDEQPVLAQASVTIFKGRTGGWCRNGEETLKVVLAPPP